MSRPAWCSATNRSRELYGMDPGELRAGTSARAFVQFVHPDDRERLRRKTDEALKSGDEFAEEFRLLRADGATRWVLAQGRCHHDASGRAARFSGATLDITERKEAEQHRVMLANELGHRVKNMLATVQAVANQTLRDDVTMAEARDRLSVRLVAMSRAQDILMGTGLASVQIESIVKTAIEPHAGDGERFRLGGPNVAVSARSALTFSMALHELATNAAKYGALSCHNGRVDIHWRISPSPEPAFELTWSGSGGPPVKPPTHEGFGSRLIKGALTAELGATTSVGYAASGTAWRIATPLDNIT